METLFYFILGVLFVTLILPTLEAVTGLLTTWFEKMRGRQEMEILKMQHDAQKECCDDGPTYAIGFDTSCGITREDLEEEEEEDE